MELHNMAGKMKDRSFAPFADSPVANGTPLLGLYSHKVTLPNGSPQTMEIPGPVSVESFVAWLDSHATDKEKEKAYTFFWRGQESMAAQKLRILWDTVVTIPGTTKTLDLMAVPVELACNAINAHEKSIQIMLAANAGANAADDADDDDEMDEEDEKAARKNRAWRNAKRFLLESNKAIEQADGTLAVNPNYTAPAVSGSSDADIYQEDSGNDIPTKPRRGRPRKNA